MEADGEVTSGGEHETQLTREHPDTEGFGALGEAQRFLFLAFIFIGKYTRAARSHSAHVAGVSVSIPMLYNAGHACMPRLMGERVLRHGLLRARQPQLDPRAHASTKNRNMQSYLTCTRLLTWFRFL